MYISDAPKPSLKVLLVDADKDSCLALRTLLEKEGYQVSQAASGLECLAIFQRERPDIVLLDMVLPGLDGFETCARLQELPGGEQIPVLLLSFLNDEASIKKTFAVGAADYISKPLNWAILRQRVKRLVAARQVEQLRNDLFYMIIHDMKNPIASINGYAEVLLEETSATTNPRVYEIGQRILQHGQELLEKAMLILDMRRLEEGRLALDFSIVAFADALENLTLALGSRLEKRNVSVVNAGAPRGLLVEMDWGLIYRAAENLALILSEQVGANNPLTFTGGFEADRQQAYLRVEFAAELKHGLASPLKALSQDWVNYHLVLNFCRLAIETQGGYLTQYSNSKSKITRFTFWFPSKLILAYPISS